VTLSTQTPAHGMSRAWGSAKTSTGQALKAPQAFAGRALSEALFSVTGGRGACEAPNLSVGTAGASAPAFFWGGT
jgi:hypothetical protein